MLCLLRMRAGSPALRRGAGGEALMGLGMAAMAVPATVLDAQPWEAPVFAAVFAAAALLALLPARGGAHHLHHAVGSLAMVYMALAPGHSGHASTAPGDGATLLTGLLLAYFAVYALRTGVRVVPPAAVPAVPASGAAAGAASPGWVVRPELATACRASMAMGMFAMLLAV
jgi:hypothetical protein